HDRRRREPETNADHRAEPRGPPGHRTDEGAASARHGAHVHRGSPDRAGPEVPEGQRRDDRSRRAFSRGARQLDNEERRHHLPRANVRDRSMIENIGPIRVLLLETEASATNSARAALARDERLHLVGTVSDQPSLIDKLVATYAQVAVVDLSGLRGEIGAAVHEILARAPECCVIITGANAAPGIVSRAVTAGARGFLLKPYQPEDLVNTIRDAYTSLQELRRLQRVDRAPGGVKPGVVIAVYSPKGGVGCTTIATNIAVALTHRAKGAVALVDLDLQFGDIGIALDLKGANSAADLLTHVDAIDSSLVDEVFVRHASGVRVLLAPDNLGMVPSIDPDRVARVVDQLRPHFQYFVCDLWSSLEDLT